MAGWVKEQERHSHVTPAQRQNRAQGVRMGTGQSTGMCGKRVEATWDSTGGPGTGIGGVMDSQVFLMAQDVATVERGLGHDDRRGSLAP